jgi:putative ABC transport system ATP-binding protein
LVRTNWRSAQRKLGFIFQSFNLLPRLTALENVMLPMLYPCKNDSQCEHKHELWRRWKRLDWKTPAAPPKRAFRRTARVAIARALINRPQVILQTTDGNLDSRSRVDIRPALLHHLHEQA